MTNIEELMSNLPNCDNCGKSALGLADGQPKYLCLNCFEGGLFDSDRKWLFGQLKLRGPSLSDEERWSIFSLVTTEMCGTCFGSAPCHCWNDE